MSGLPVVVVTRQLPPAVEARLTRSFDARLNAGDKPFSADDLTRAMTRADALLCTVSDHVPGDMLRTPGRRVSIIANFGVGHDNIDTGAAQQAGVAVTNTPDVLTGATADIALFLILASTRRTSAAERMLRTGAWKGRSIMENQGTGIQGKTLGIAGMGRIGRATARRAALGTGMNIIFYNRSPVTDLPFPARQVTLETLMRESDVISLHIPGGGNGPVIGADLIAMMKPEACLVNTARGSVIDETALAAALAEGRIAGAGLDVFADEPRVPESLTRLWNVTLLPHIGSSTRETCEAMGMLAAENLECWFSGRPCPHRVV